MSQSLLFARSGIVTPILLTLGLLFFSCSSGVRGEGGAKLNRAIESFIAGDYDSAISRLEELADATNSNEELQQIYLYLGRSYVATEQYARAIDAFNAGMALGGGSPFDEYLIRLGVVVSGTPETVSMSDRVTRAQLAALIDHLFYSGSGDTGGDSGRGAPEGAVAELESVKRGVVPPLPDGDFYPDALVTRAALYAAVARLAADLGAEGEGEPSAFIDGGYDWVTVGGVEGGAPNTLVTGKETLTALQRVSEARRSFGG
jgi:tetratricopeptide (TPR) repeat protein